MEEQLVWAVRVDRPLIGPQAKYQSRVIEDIIHYYTHQIVFPFSHKFLGMYGGRISVSCSGWSAADLTSNQVLWSSYRHTNTQNSGYLK